MLSSKTAVRSSQSESQWNHEPSFSLHHWLLVLPFRLAGADKQTQTVLLMNPKTHRKTFSNQLQVPHDGVCVMDSAGQEANRKSVPIDQTCQGLTFDPSVVLLLSLLFSALQVFQFKSTETFERRWMFSVVVVVFSLSEPTSFIIIEQHHAEQDLLSSCLLCETVGRLPPRQLISFL